MNSPGIRTDSDAKPVRAAASHHPPHLRVVSNDSQEPVQRSLASAVLLHATEVKRSYHKGEVVIPVLRGVDLQVRQGQFTSIVGQSGSGKSTLLHLLATLDEPDAGKIFFENNRIDNLSAAGRDALRNRHFGMIFQFYHLLPELTTLENVLMPLMISNSTISYWRQAREFRKRGRQLLEMVGLDHRIKHRPNELSGGEMQRVAIARSLIANPRILYADEPTGNLDSQTGQDIMQILRRLNADEQLTIVMVTHDQEIAAQADHTVRLVEGKVESD